MPSEYTISDALSYRSRVVDELQSLRSLVDNFDPDESTLSDIRQFADNVRAYVGDVEAAVPCEDGVEQLARYGARDIDTSDLEIECNCESDHSDCFDSDDVIISVNDDTAAITEAGYVSLLKMSQRIEQIRQLQGKYQERALAVLAHQLRDSEDFDPDGYWSNASFNEDEFNGATQLYGYPR